MANHGSNIHSIIVACFFALSCSESLASLLDSVEAATMHALSDAEELALRSSHDPVNGFVSRVKKADSRFNAKGAGDVEDSESKSKATTVTGTADSEDVVTIGIPPFKRQKILNLAPHEVQEDEMSDSSSEGPPPLLSGTPPFQTPTQRVLRRCLTMMAMIPQQMKWTLTHLCSYCLTYLPFRFFRSEG